MVLFAHCALAQSPTKPLVQAAPVVVGQATRGSVPLVLTSIGTVEASEVVDIKARINGLVEVIHFTEGQDVCAGDLLFSIDSRDLEAGLRMAQAGLERSQAQLTKAAEDKRRYDELLRQGIISKDQQETTDTTLRALQAEVQAARAAVESATVDLSFAKIHSPITGRTGALGTHAGNMIKANADAPMVTLFQVEPVHVRFAVPETHLGSIVAGQGHSSLVVRAQVPGRPQAETGTLYFIDGSVDTATGTIALKARFTNSARNLWPGQFVEVSLVVGALDDVVLVPDQAVLPGADGEFVYIVRPDNTVDYRVVSTEMRHAGQVVVGAGLNGNETVVLDGQLRLFPGATVTIRADADNKPQSVGADGLQE